MNDRNNNKQLINILKQNMKSMQLSRYNKLFQQIENKYYRNINQSFNKIILYDPQKIKISRIKHYDLECQGLGMLVCFLKEKIQRQKIRVFYQLKFISKHSFVNSISRFSSPSRYIVPIKNIQSTSKNIQSTPKNRHNRTSTGTYMLSNRSNISNISDNGLTNKKMNYQQSIRNIFTNLKAINNEDSIIYNQHQKFTIKTRSRSNYYEPSKLITTHTFNEFICPIQHHQCISHMYCCVHGRH